MSWTVLSVAYPFAPVGPHAVGGAEQILTELDGALTAAGHNSLVLACEGSEAAGELFAVSSRDEPPQNHHSGHFQTALDEICASRRIDLIHMHGFDFHQYRLPADIPVLVTLHLPAVWYPQSIWYKLPETIQIQCVSDSQRRSCPHGYRDLPVVVNGVGIPARVHAARKSGFALALGRICPEKNQHVALQAGSLADTRVLLGGRLFPFPEHQQYFRQKIQPLLAANNGIVHEFLGPLDAQRKQQLLAEAKCLLHPTLAPETSSLVAMEALATGTPVIAYRSGSLPDIVDHGITGFLVNNVEEMADAIHRARSISPQACRAAAVQRFSRERMVREYFHLYRSMLRKTVAA